MAETMGAIEILRILAQRDNYRPPGGGNEFTDTEWAQNGAKAAEVVWFKRFVIDGVDRFDRFGRSETKFTLVLDVRTNLVTVTTRGLANPIDIVNELSAALHRYKEEREVLLLPIKESEDPSPMVCRTPDAMRLAALLHFIKERGPIHVTKEDTLQVHLY